MSAELNHLKKKVVVSAVKSFKEKSGSECKVKSFKEKSGSECRIKSFKEKIVVSARLSHL